MTEIHWKHYLTRPFDLLGVSIWNYWYNSDIFEEINEMKFKNAFFVESHPRAYRFYKDASEVKRFHERCQKLIDNPEEWNKIYERGKFLNEKSKKILKKELVLGFDELFDFSIELPIYATVIPNNVRIVLGNSNSKIARQAEELRSISYYPQIIYKILMPLIKEKARSLGLREEYIEFLTIEEFQKGDISKAKERYNQHKKGMCFIHKMIDGQKETYAVENPLAIVKTFEELNFDDKTEIKGMTGYKGKVIGKARLAITENPAEVHFEKGEILVSIHSSPVLMPLINKCAAIVTDEGGVSCHAVIISREMKIPSVVSTKVATHIIKDGDLLEVDADNGIVRKINK